MSQHDYTISDQNGASFLADLLGLTQAIVTNNSGTTAPSTTYAGMIWLDTTENKIKRRNQDNDGWVILGDLDEEFMGLLSRAGGAMSGVLQLKKSTDIASGATTDLGTADGNDITITHSSGTVAITSFGGATSLQAGTVMDVTFSISGGTLSLTHNATSLYIPGGNSLTLSDKDKLRVRKTSDSSANWEVIGVTKADGTPLVDAPDASETTKGIVEKATAAEAISFTADKYIDGERLQSAFNATGSAPFFACRAWVNFNGTGTVAIRASGNVTSITDDGIGSYTINMTTALPDTNYAAIGTVSRDDSTTSSTNIPIIRRSGMTASSFSAVCRTASETVMDAFNANFAVFR